MVYVKGRKDYIKNYNKYICECGLWYRLAHDQNAAAYFPVKKFYMTRVEGVRQR